MNRLMKFCQSGVPPCSQMQVPAVSPHGADVFHWATTRAHCFPTASSHKVGLLEPSRRQNDTKHTPCEAVFINALWNVATLRQNSRGSLSNQARNRLFFLLFARTEASNYALEIQWTIQKKPLKRSPTVTKDKEHRRGVPGKHQTPLYLSKLGFHHSRHNLFCKDYEYKWNLLQIIDAVSSE